MHAVGLITLPLIFWLQTCIGQWDWFGVLWTWGRVWLANCKKLDKGCTLYTFVIPRTYTHLSDRTLPVAGPRLWSSLPSNLWQSDLTLQQFRWALKTYLFGCLRLQHLVTFCLWCAIQMFLLTSMSLGLMSIHAYRLSIGNVARCGGAVGCRSLPTPPDSQQQLMALVVLMLRVLLWYAAWHFVVVAALRRWKLSSRSRGKTPKWRRQQQLICRSCTTW